MHDLSTPHVWLTHRVSYGETDTMGYLYYAEYLHLFERARGEFIRSLGMSYAEVERRGILLPVRKAQCHYRLPAHYDDLIQVRVSVSKIGGASMTFVYSVMDEERKREHATGFTEHACAGPNGSPVRMPLWLRELLQTPENLL